MRKTGFLLTAGVLLVVVAACGGGQTTPTSNVPTLEATATTEASPLPGQAACRAVSPVGYPVDDLPPVTDRDWSIGPADAPVTLIEYADFQCPGCAGMHPLLARLVDVHGDNLRFVYRHFPLTFHDKSMITAEATEAAGAQGAFWEMHDLIFERYMEWAQLPADQMVQVLAGYAQELGLDGDRFTRDLENHTFREKVQAQYDEAMSLQLPGTPTFIVNGRMYPADQWGLSYLGVDAFIRLATLKQYDAPPPQVIEPGKQYRAIIRTARGDITIELYADQAPTNVNSFVFLARDGWYDGVLFHRVIPGFVAQSGDPTGTGAGGPGYQCDDEIGSLSFDQAGVVGIANAGPNTGSSQFFITLSPQPGLDGHYTIIGRVVKGMDVLQSLTPRDPNDPEAPAGDVIETILIEVQ